MSKDNIEPAIFIADFAGKCIREKVMMDKPMPQSYYDNYPMWQWSDIYNKALHNYEDHINSRRTYPYPVKPEQDGKEIKESEFRLRHQWYDDKNNIWVDYFEVETQYMVGKNYKTRIIAIPIEPEGLPDQKDEIEQAARKYATSIVKGPTQWEQFDRTKYKAFLKGVEYIKSLSEPSSKEQEAVSMEEYNHAIEEIGQLQEQLKEAEDYIKELQKPEY